METLGIILALVVILTLMAVAYGKLKEKNAVAKANRDAVEKAKQTEEAINKLPAGDIFDRYDQL
jgi:uncharacterized membrane protein